MIRGQRVVALVPARAGSKSIPNKNLALLGDRSLLRRAIDVAKQVVEIDRVLVSSDGDHILAAAREAGAEPWKRPERLATDTAVVNDTIQDVITRLRQEGEDATIMILLEPTCPLRAADDIRDCLIKLIEENLDSVATFKEADLNPHRAWRIENGCPTPYMADALPWLPRQALPTALQLSGGVYVFRSDRLPIDSPSLLFGAAGAVVVPHDRSVDIDRPTDLLVAEATLKDQKSSAD